jgi:hypothetical protein
MNVVLLPKAHANRFPRVELHRYDDGWMVHLFNEHGERRYDSAADLLTEEEAQVMGYELAEFLGWPVRWVR